MVMITLYEPNEIEGIRKALGMTPKQFADELGVSIAAVSRWKHGSRLPRMETLRKLNDLVANKSKKRLKPVPA